jgi:hypothetical protein
MSVAVGFLVVALCAYLLRGLAGNAIIANEPPAEIDGAAAG